MKIFFNILVSVLIIINGCVSENSNHFYSYNRDFDLWRFPLTEPYEIISSNEEDWVLQLHHINPSGIGMDDYGVGGIDSISIINNIILVHGYVNRRHVDKIGFAWVVIDVENDTINFYSSADEGKFRNKLEELRASNYKAYDFNKVNKEFQQDLKLPPEWYRKQEEKQK